MPSPTLTPSQIAAKEAAVKEHEWLAGNGLDVDTWVELQNTRTEHYLNQLPGIDGFREVVHGIVDAPYRSAPTVRAGKSFSLRRQPGEQQASLWVSDDAGERCLVSASEFGAVSDAIAEFSPSPDGMMVAWALSHGGADWMVARFRSTTSGLDNDDVIDGIKWPSFAWLDNNTVAYLSWARPPAGQELTAANSGSSVRAHRVGTDQFEDTVLFQPDGVAWVIPTVSADQKWLVVQESVGTTPAKIYRQPVATARVDGWETVVDGTGPDTVIDIVDDETLVLSHANSPMGQVVGYRADGTRRVIHDATTLSLDSVELVGKRLLLLGNKIEGSVFQLVDLAGGGLATFDIPHDSVVEDVAVDSVGETVYVGLQEIGGPRRVVQYSAAGESTSNGLVTPQATDVAFDSAEDRAPQWQVSTFEVTSADGTSVPMRIVRAAGVVPDNNAKVLLSVYGGYSVHYLSSAYDSWHGAWLKAGGVLAYAGVRGGSELGETWHEAAMRENKQRGIDDLFACIEWFELNGWASPKSVAINGMSNGGMMVSTALTQRPELLGAAVPEVAVVDMLNFHKYTAAHGWIREFGDPDVPEDRAILAAYSPLHNISRRVEYPPTLVLTADKDDRVPPGPHSYKLAAELQETLRGRDTTYLRVSRDAGHAIGRSVIEKVAERSAVLSFAAHALGLEAPIPQNTTQSNEAHEAAEEATKTSAESSSYAPPTHR